jgi:ankyrin repeat protein
MAGTPPNLEQRRKRAKDLVRDHRQGDGSAARRIRSHLPRASAQALGAILEGPFRLAEAQLVVAREEGFESWARMKHALEARQADARARKDALLEAAVAGDRPRVEALLAADPDLPRRSLHAACALGSPPAVRAVLRAGAAPAVERDGPAAWTPLLYLCCARLPAAEGDGTGERVEIARLLLDAGADARDATDDATLAQGLRSVLSGAVAIVGSAALARLLVEAGAGEADHLWKMAILADAARHPGLELMGLLLPLRPPSWELNGALAVRLKREDLEGVRLLLAAGADPNASGVWGRLGSSLHHAVLGGRGPQILSALLEAGADVARRDRDGRTALAVAHRAGHRVAIDRLLEAGARAEDVEPVDRVIAAATAGDAVELDRLLAAAPDIGLAYRRSDHQMLCWAIRRGRSEVVPLLLRAGLDPRIRDDDGHTPLALAAAAGDPSTVAALLSAGAPLDDLDFDGGSPLERALETPHETGRGAVVRALLGAGASVGELRGFPTGDARLDAELRRGGAVESQDDDTSFERAVDAVVDGDTAALGQLLEEEPELVLRRSARPHRATLLHYVVADRRAGGGEGRPAALRRQSRRRGDGAAAARARSEPRADRRERRDCPRSRASRRSRRRDPPAGVSRRLAPGWYAPAASAHDPA